MYYNYIITNKKQGKRLAVVTGFSVGVPDFKKWWSNRPQDIFRPLFALFGFTN